MSEEIKVSINCTTYNHELYIADAIESFLMQKTNFKYEILINDDASIDKTTQIIKRYEEKYPDIIKPIYQSENKYSKGVKVGYEYNFKRAKGKYIAICEGDDYWTDPYKLQKQVDYMEENPECTLCVHAVKEIESDTNELIRVIRPYESNRKCETIDFITKGGDFVGTNSILFPRKAFINAPKWYMNCPVGDYPMQIFLSNEGYAYYIDETMSAYRIRSKESWTSTVFNDDDKRNKHWDDIDKMLNEVDVYTNKKYFNEIHFTKLQNRFTELLRQNKYRELKKEEYREIYSKMSTKFKFGILIKQYLPKCIYDKIYNVRRVLKNAK